MPKFMFNAGYTASGIEGLQREGGTGRRAMFAAMIEKLGGNLEVFYYAFGPNDLVIIADLPDDESAAAVSMEIAKSGRGPNRNGCPHYARDHGPGRRYSGRLPGTRCLGSACGPVGRPRPVRPPPYSGRIDLPAIPGCRPPGGAKSPG